MREFIFAAASEDMTSTGWYNLSEALDQSTERKPHGVNFDEHALMATFAHSSATGAVGTLVMALVEYDATTHKVLAYFTGTVTPTARRSNLANTAANNYVCNVAWQPGGTHIFDLLGHGRTVRGSTAASGTTVATGGGSEGTASNRGTRLDWVLGCVGLGGLTEITVGIETTKRV